MDTKSIRVISWDVGVIHLAYCILEDVYDEKHKKHNINILDWDEIDLLEDDRLSLICCGKKKAKKGQEAESCNNKAGYYQCISGKNIGFCKTHLYQHTEYWSECNTRNLFKKTTKEHKCEHVMKSGKKCTTKAKLMYNKKNHYCMAHGKTLLKNKIKEYNPQPIRNTIVQKYPTAKLQLTLMKKLDNLIEHFVKLGISGVMIENQPSQKNPKMKSIANTLFDYFLMRCQIDHVHGVNLDFVKFINPSNKLKINGDNTLAVFKANKDETKKYKLTKQLGIQYTRQLLCNDPFQLEYLNMYKKKDDLCDAYLQGRYYLEFRHVFPKK